MVLYLWMMVQVICESLPISSSGHVALLQNILSKYYPTLLPTENLWAFDYVLQGISAAVILVYFFTAWWQLVVSKPIRIASLCTKQVWKSHILPTIIFGGITDAVTALLWVMQSIYHVQIPLFLGFIITAAALWSMQYARENKKNIAWSYRDALILGFVQGCALLPGISRFGITIATLAWLGYAAHIAFAISFLVQWPLIVAGSLLGMISLHDSSVLATMMSLPFIGATLVCACIGYTVLCLVGKIIAENKLWKFSYYMIIPTGIACLLAVCI